MKCYEADFWDSPVTISVMRTPDGVTLQRTLPVFFGHRLVLISRLTQVLPRGLFSSDSVTHLYSLKVSVYRLRGFDHQGHRCLSVKGLRFGVRVCISVVIGVKSSCRSRKDCM